MSTLSADPARFQEMKAYVGFTAEDSARLRAFWPVVEPHVEWICDRFYDRILATPSAREVLQHESQVASLKITLAQWLRELLQGPHDAAYYERRRRIGRRHVEVGLPVRFMFMAMSGFCQDLLALVEDLPEPDRLPTRLAVRRITDIDLAAMTGTFVEERESRQLENLQDLIVSHMPVAILLFDREGRLTASTRAADRYLRGGARLGVRWREALPQGLIDAADLEALVNEALRTRHAQVLPRVDATLDERVGSYRITAVPLDHPRARVLLHIEDLSEAVQLEARMQQSEALAHLGSLSAAVAHELRNPLAGMSAAVQVLVPSFDDGDRRKQILGKFDEQVRRLDVLVNDLLSFARPGQAHMRSVCLRTLAENAVELVKHDAVGTRFEVVGEGTGYADANLAHQILLNLVHNAVHAAGEGGRVRVEVADGRLAVEDDGPGIPEGIRAEVFKPFFTTRTRGTGLGLAICMRSAVVMGAELVLADGGTLPGARFDLRLPRDPS